MSRRKVTPDDAFDQLCGSVAGFLGADVEIRDVEEDLLQIIERRGGPEGLRFAQTRRERS